MKSFFRATAVAICLLFCFFTLTACKPELPEIPEDGATITIVIGVNRQGSSYTYAKTFDDIVTHHRFLGQVLDEIVAENGLAFEYSRFVGVVSRFPQRLGDLASNTANNEFIALYAYGLGFAFAGLPTKQVDGRTFRSANYGIDELPIADGAIYLFAISTF